MLAADTCVVHRKGGGGSGRGELGVGVPGRSSRLSSMAGFRGKVSEWVPGLLPGRGPGKGLRSGFRASSRAGSRFSSTLVPGLVSRLVPG